MATRRNPPRRRPRNDNRGTKFVVAGAALLVVLGLGIGQFVGHRGGAKSPPKPGPVHTVNPTPTPRPTPAVMHTIVFPSATPRVTATPRATSSPTVSPTVAATSTARPLATGSPHASASVVPSGRPQTPATNHPHAEHTRYPVTQAMLAGKSNGRPATAAPATSARAKTAVPVAAITEPPKKVSPTPAPLATKKPVTPTRSAAPQSPSAKSSNPGASTALHSQAKIAQKVVRSYLTALIRGDERTAYHHLGGNAGDAGLSLSEETFIDHSAKISDVQAQPDASGVNIQAEIAAKHGLYFATYRVEYRKGRATIVAHDFIKP